MFTMLSVRRRVALLLRTVYQITVALVMTTALADRIPASKLVVVLFVTKFQFLTFYAEIRLKRGEKERETKND